MEDNEIRSLCVDLLETSWPVYFTTVDEKGYPQTRAMFNLRNKDHFPKLIPFFEKERKDLEVVFTTNTSSAKVSELRVRRPVSAYYCDPDKWRGVMLGGEVEIVKDSELKKELWHDDWEKYYPKGYDDPDHTVLKLTPAVVKGWAGSMTFRMDLGDRK